MNQRVIALEARDIAGLAQGLDKLIGNYVPDSEEEVINEIMAVSVVYVGSYLYEAIVVVNTSMLEREHDLFGRREDE